VTDASFACIVSTGLLVVSKHSIIESLPGGAAGGAAIEPVDCSMAAPSLPVRDGKLKGTHELACSWEKFWNRS